MVKYILKRLLLMVATLFIIMTVCFILIRLLPYPLPQNFTGDQKEAVEAYRSAMGLDDPVLMQYVIYLKNIFTKFDFGKSIYLYKWVPVTTALFEKLPATIAINLYAMIFSVPIGLTLGIFSALKKNKWQDQVISVGVMLFISVPSYIYAFALQYFLGYRLDLFPPLLKNGTDFFSLKMLHTMVLPILSLSFGTIAGLTRYTRAELTEVLTSEFMVLARTKGLSRGQATIRHALRNSMVPIFPMILGEFISILAGSMIIENIFSVPGVGDIYIRSINELDYDLFLFLNLFYVSIGLLAGLVVDLSYGIVDPRIRIGGKK